MEFIKKNNLCVISTVGKDCKPQSAAMEFGETENLELIFDTYKDSRKYKNIQENKNVSVVIG
ncbi:MAG: pyridoxamine 5'-phosphate oxidase family protein [Patescibacteria group bacterium]|nr:pyridoxamine 5'-phosphate oxidase family protein [Patescibacteria group bacterium]